MGFRIQPHMRLHEWVADKAGLLRRFGPGERIVPQPYTRDMYARTYRWMQDWSLVDPAQDRAGYDEAVLV